MAMSQQFPPPVNQYTGSFTEDADLVVLGTLVFAGPTRESIAVMVPDCIVPPVNSTVCVDLRHEVGLSLGRPWT